MKKCFTINQMRKRENFVDYMTLLDEGLYEAIELFYPYNQSFDQLKQYTNSVNEIINKLNLKRTKEDKDQLINAAKLQAYLTTSDDYKKEKMCFGNNILKYNLFHGLINGTDDYIINACIFTEVLRKVGMDVLNVVLKLQDSNYYVANLVLIGKEYYFFDLTLEREIFKDNGEDVDNFILCCAALGKNSYTQFFKPLCIVDFNDQLAPNSLPKNISSDIILRYVRSTQNTKGENIERLYNIIQDKVEATEFIIKEGSVVANTPLSKLPLKENVLVASITRGDKVILPRGWNELEPNDRVVFISSDLALRDISDVLKQ